MNTITRHFLICGALVALGLCGANTLWAQERAGHAAAGDSSGCSDGARAARRRAAERDTARRDERRGRQPRHE